MAGYDSAHAPLASRIFSAASFARPTVHPRPRNTKWSNAPTSSGRSAASARSPSWATGSRSSPSPARSSASAPVANRVWTTERSSAKPRMIAFVRRVGDRRVVDAADRHRARAFPRPFEQPCHLGRRAAPRDRHHHVVDTFRRGPPRRRTRRSRPPRPPPGARRRPARRRTRSRSRPPRHGRRIEGGSPRRREPRRRRGATCPAGSSAHARFRSFERTLLHERSSEQSKGLPPSYTPGRCGRRIGSA